MNTVLHRNEDGFEIVVGFREGNIDPRATDKIVASEVLSLPELAQASAIKMKISAQCEIARDNWNLAKLAEKEGRTLQMNAYIAIRNAALAQAQLLEEDLKPIAAAFEKARADLWFSKAVYFTPGPGQDMISDADFASLSAALESLAKGKVLLLDGTVIADNRGRTHWMKSGGEWKSTTVVVLGEEIPAGAILEEKLTDAQRTEIAGQAEVARIAGLSVGEKADELARVLKAASREAVELRSEAEVTGEAFDAPAWYQAKKAEIEAKYK